MTAGTSHISREGLSKAATTWWLFSVVALRFCFTSVAFCAQRASSEDLEILLDAIAEIESNNRADAIGDKGQAIGAYQIHRAYWEDGTRILGVDWSYSEAFNPKKARRVVRAYLLYYGEGRSLMDMARIHNGGPKGYKKRSTLVYARKIRSLLQRKGKIYLAPLSRNASVFRRTGGQDRSSRGGIVKPRRQGV